MSTTTAEPIRRILFPTDFSPVSSAAFSYAERLAASTNATILALHVFDIPDFWGSGGEPDHVDEGVKQKLKEVQPSLTDVDVEYIAHGGPPGPVICWVAQDQRCDLIVMGTHGQSGLTHILLGSVAEYVVRHATCPVLTTRLRTGNEKPLKEPEVYLPMPAIM